MTLLLLGLLECGCITARAADIGTAFGIQQQSQKTVTGIVLDEHGDPVIGASVAVQGSKSGAVTDIDGKFSIEVAPGAVLTVSYVGYETQTMSVANRNTVRVVLVPAQHQLNEVVVTALGIRREKKALGYAMQEVDAA